MDWQPIETSPKVIADDVLLWNGERVFVGWWSDGEGWIDSTVPDYESGPETPQPTHWMPLPPPPRLE